MPHKDPEARKEYRKMYQKINKEQLNEYQKMYRENNKEQIREYMKEWRENNKEYKKEHAKMYYENNIDKIKEYRQTHQGKKTQRISDWKRSGISQDYDFDTIYDIYINTDVCDYCNVNLVEGCTESNRRCLDHDHVTGEIRGILCNTCNTKDVLKTD